MSRPPLRRTILTNRRLVMWSRSLQRRSSVRDEGTLRSLRMREAPSCWIWRKMLRRITNCREASRHLISTYMGLSALGD